MSVLKTDSNEFRFSKSLGQNFIINPKVCPKIAEAAGCEKETAVFEIGAGAGILTKELSKRCGKVLTLEIDETLKPILNLALSETKFNNVEIKYGDVMKMDLKKLFREHFKEYNDIICCANIPYYITTPLIMKLLEEKLPLNSITLMVQKEAGERLCAEPGKRGCGAVSAAVRFHCRPEKLFSVSRSSFRPSPKVDSVVIKLSLDRKNIYDIKDEKLFFRMIRASFSQRRKQLVNPLSEELKIDKNQLKQIMIKNNINSAARAENLTMEDWVNFCGSFYSK